MLSARYFGKLLFLRALAAEPIFWPLFWLLWAAAAVWTYGSYNFMTNFNCERVLWTGNCSWKMFMLLTPARTWGISLNNRKWHVDFFLPVFGSRSRGWVFSKEMRVPEVRHETNKLSNFLTFLSIGIFTERFWFYRKCTEKLIAFGISNWSTRIRFKEIEEAKHHFFSISTEMLSANASHFTKNRNVRKTRSRTRREINSLNWKR